MKPRTLWVLLLVLLAVGCGQAPADRLTGSPPGMAADRPAAGPTANLRPTREPDETSTRPATPTSSPTPTITPSPTPTAVPLIVAGDPRAELLRTPEPQPGAPCGLVDLFDFPIDPPDAEAVIRGGQDFGVYRSRYTGYHTGEDWWLSRGGSNFGVPVYSIGHGRVTYADPNGWGRDKGVMVIQHTFADGRTVLSFYGHLDPPSVELRAGDCVTRGQQIGAIGKPRTPPHLHFEIRTHLPYGPGGGYWAEDPTLAGWLPPSQTIWDSRILASPNVQWHRLAPAGGSRAVGLAGDQTFVTLEDDQLVGLDLADGRPAWILTGSGEIDGAALDAVQPVVYLADQLGRLEAYSLTGAAEPLWALDLNGVGVPSLLPLPTGGVLVSMWERMFAVSAGGALLWQDLEAPRPYDWAIAGNHLILSTLGGDRSLWAVTETGLARGRQHVGGPLAAAGDQLYVLDQEGVFRLDLAESADLQDPAVLQADLLYPLPAGLPGQGDLLPLPDGGVLVVHIDRHDRRLIALGPDGALKWAGSLREAVAGEPHLLRLGQDVYLASQAVSNGAAAIALYAVDLDQGALRHLFTGGTRSASADQTAFYARADDLLLLQIGGGGLVAYRPG